MRQKKTDLKKLAELADIVLEKELEQLSAIGQTVAALERSVQDLDDALQLVLTEAAKAGENFGPSVARHTQNWQYWRRRKRAELVLKLTKTKARQEEIRTSARVAFGRVQALRQLSEMP